MNQILFHDSFKTRGRRARDINATHAMDARALIAANLPLAGARVIEAGCGSGENTAFLARHAAELLALDISPAMLTLARARAGAAHVRFVEHDITQSWPAPDGWAMVVVSDLALDHIADIMPVFRQMRRVLAPGGIAYLAELHPWRQHGSAACENDDTPPLHTFPHSVSDYIAAAIAADLAIVQMKEHDDPDGRPRLLALTLEAK